MFIDANGNRETIPFSTDKGATIRHTAVKYWEMCGNWSCAHIRIAGKIVAVYPDSDVTVAYYQTFASKYPNSKTGATSVTLDSLPDDMQVLIGDLAQDEGQESYQVVEIPISDLPNLPIADGTQDQRGEPTVQAMVDSTDELPPIIVSGDNILDGRHRIEAARRKGVTSIKAIDIGALVSCMCKKLKSSKP